ncbi:class I SAM-dependent methyltransferase [Ostreiculturibacter nitratireducens]|uniref:class I SAM-dependent methyltransferase n=1 Tax=Ostreiculturibacter nitratireducens TaxID=3075226 RepID=UPI0031B613B2
MSVAALAQRSYVAVLRGLRGVLRPLGFLGWLERRGTRRALWLRSLFAIYDMDDLVRLDLAWWTFDALDAVDRFLSEGAGKRVFEYGSGASTVWLARRRAEVVSVDHDADWHARVRRQMQDNPAVRLLHVPSESGGRIGSSKPGFEGQSFDSYVAAIRDAGGPFDLIVIDGRAREACLTEVVEHLADGGIILLDDTNRRRYREAITRSGLASLRLDGMAVCLPYRDSTTLLARDQTALDRLGP